MEKNHRPCPHIGDQSETFRRVYRMLYKIFIVSSARHERTLKQQNKTCHSCRTSGVEIHACMNCIYFGCENHIREHMKEKEHCFTVDLMFGQLYCTKCQDYVYSGLFDEISMEVKFNAGQCRKRLFSWTFYESTGESTNLLKYNAKRICITPESTIGLRGLLNLGSTCFMNCIIQTFMHMPLLREYFLTERHRCTRTTCCLVCELSKLFQDFYKGMTEPLSLHKLLHLIWTHSKHLAKYAQQDAHEFFIAMLEVLQEHGKSCGPDPSKSNNSKRSISIIDQIFTGRLQNDVVCKECKGVSTKIDPMKDIALDLGPISGGRPPLNIKECLERYTCPEDLGESEKIMCSNCNSNQESTKQLTMKTLPIVASFYLKRFEHFDGIEKISTKISFPETLDMTPYMSKYKDNMEWPINNDNKYSLFAVINHVGNSLNDGHYTAYVRQQRDYWYKCNDHVITRATIEEVLESEAYLLFYHKNILLYD